MDRLRVLVADDHTEMREMIVQMLASEFHVVDAVRNGRDLVKAANHHKPDVIISDISMPLLDGFGARKQLLSKGKKYPFVFITLMDLEGTMPKAGDAPIGYVHKKDLDTELKAAIDAVLAGSVYVSRSFRSGNPL